MTEGGTQPMVIAPPRKGARFLFLPTALLGGLAVVGGAVGAVTGRVGWGAAPLIAFGLLMALVGVYALTVRGRVVVDRVAGEVVVERWSALSRSVRTHALGAFDRVELKRVRRAAQVDQPSPVGAYTMVFLVGPEVRVHVASDEGEAARALADALARFAGLAVREA